MSTATRRHSEPIMTARGIVNVRGEYAGVTMYEGAKYAVCTEGGPRTLDCEALLPKPRE